MKRFFNTFYNNDPPDEDEEENFKLFGKFFSRASADPKWLETVKSSLSSGAAAITEAPKELAGYLQKQLDKTEAALASTTEKLEKARDLMTQEQLALLRSPPSVEAGGPVLPSPKGASAPKPAAPTPSPAKPKKKWL